MQDFCADFSNLYVALQKLALLWANFVNYMQDWPVSRRIVGKIPNIREDLREEQEYLSKQS